VGYPNPERKQEIESTEKSWLMKTRQQFALPVNNRL
jgi:hypothetical protein